MNIRSLKKYFKNLKKYITSGGVVYTNVSVVSPNNVLAGKTIFISGGTSGIGLGIAKMFLLGGVKL